MKRKYFPFCFYVLVSVLCLGKPSLAYPSGSFGRGLVTPTVIATSETDSITPLKIGDKIPDELWDYAFPVVSPHVDQVQYLTLDDFRDKLIILDFWATWCGSCYPSLDSLSSMQNMYDDKLFVLAVSSQDKDVIEPVVNKKNWSFPALFADEVLRKVFPHRGLPHQVWIKDGKVVSFPVAATATSDNVFAMINGGERTIVEKHELLDFDRTQLLFDMVDPLETDLLWTRGFTSYTPGLGSNILRPNPTSINFINLAPIEFLRTVYANHFEIYERFNRILFDVESDVYDRLFISSDKIKDKRNAADYLKWQRSNLYCYSAKFPDETPREVVSQLIKDDIDAFFKHRLGIKAKLKEVRQKCLIVVDSKNEKSFTTHGGDESLPFEDFIYRLLFSNRLYELPILNEVEGDMANIENLPDLTDLDKVRSHLQSYGLDLIEDYRTITMLVISETTSQ